MSIQLALQKKKKKEIGLRVREKAWRAWRQAAGCTVGGSVATGGGGGLAPRAPGLGLLPGRLRAALTPATGCGFSVLVIINSTAVTIGVRESFESSGKHDL